MDTLTVTLIQGTNKHAHSMIDKYLTELCTHYSWNLYITDVEFIIY